MNRPRTIGCKVAGCDRPHRSKGYCNIHYQRMHRLGTPNLPARGIPNERASRKAPARRGGSVEDAIKVYATIAGTVTLEQWKRHREEQRADVHVVQLQPRCGHGGDAA